MSKAFSVRLEEKLISQLKELSIKDNRTLNNLIETILLEYVRKNTENNSKGR